MNYILYFAILLCFLGNIVQTIWLKRIKTNLVQEKLNNQILQKKYDGIRAFKHDFSNIIAGLDGYIKANDMKSLKEYHNKFFKDYKQLQDLDILNAGSINNPAVLSILTQKFLKAEEFGVRLNIECFMDFDKLNMNIYRFSRILGILTDNAIEASKECEDKIVNIIIRDDVLSQKQILTIENTYKNKDLDLDKIYKKGFSTKPSNMGIGLWNVNNIVNKNKNLELFTNNSDKMFSQRLEISY